jgi:dGTPase
MGSGQSDFYRTRLTHSLEAAQIGSGITSHLRHKYIELCQRILPSEDSLIETICLAHDIGHPPFGHGGEVALHYMMHKDGGFEGNGQTLRIVAQLEPFSEHYGMNLARRTLLGLIKYPQTLTHLSNQKIVLSPDNFRQLKANLWHPPKGIYQDDNWILDWVLAPLSVTDREQFQSINKNENNHHRTRFKSFDCSIMELADDIAYGIHDLEDAIATGVVSRESFELHVINKLANIDDDWLQIFIKDLANKLFSEYQYKQKSAIGSLVNYLITAIEIVDLNEQQQMHFAEPLLRYNAKLPTQNEQALRIFKDYVLQFVIQQTDIQRREYRGQQIVMELFEAMASDPERLLPKTTLNNWRHACDNNLNTHRVIVDYVSGMTDDYATRLYKTLF